VILPVVGCVESPRNPGFCGTARSRGTVWAAGTGFDLPLGRPPPRAKRSDLTIFRCFTRASNHTAADPRMPVSGNNLVNATAVILRPHPELVGRASDHYSEKRSRIGTWARKALGGGVRKFQPFSGWGEAVLALVRGKQHALYSYSNPRFLGAPPRSAVRLGLVGPRWFCWRPGDFSSGGHAEVTGPEKAG